MKKFTLSFLLLAFTATLSAQWSNDIAYNNALTDGSRTLYSTDVKANNDGITYLFYNTPDGGYTVSYLQIFDEEGLPLLGTDGIIISDTLTRSYDMVNERILIDKDGNAILVVCDCRNSTEDVKDLTYAVYKVSPEGEMLWSEEGVDLYKGTSASLVAALEMIELEDGSYVFTWMEVIGLSSDGSELLGVRTERLSNDGEFCWDAPLTINSSTANYSYPCIQSAGNNQFIIVYAQGSNQTLYARKVDFDGSSVWAEDTKAYIAGFNSTVPIYTQMTTTYDPNGGIFIVFYADPYYTGCEAAYLCYVKADGSLGFSEGTAGLPVCYSDYMRALTVDATYSTTDDCVYVSWRGVAYSSSSYQSINVQKVSMQGELMWGTEGIYVKPIDVQSFGSCYVKSNGEEEGFTVFFMDFVESWGNTDHYAVKYNSSGETAWEGDGAYHFSPTVGNKGALEVSELINGEYWLATWEEDRIMSDDSNNMVYAERIYTNEASNDGIENTTNDNNTFAARAFDGTVYFATSFTNDATATVTLYDVSGEIVGTTTIAAGSNTASYSTTGLAAGVYIATLTNGSVATSTKLIIR